MKDMIKYASVLLVVIVFMFAGCSADIPANQPLADRGILDLSYWNLERGLLKLDGQWEFYWNQSGTNDLNGYINVPGSWNGFKTNGRNLPQNGFATYKLTLRTGSGQRMALYIPIVFTSYDIYFNDKPVASAGKAGQDRKNSSPEFSPQVVIIDVQAGDNEIIIHVSNFYHRSGGLLESILIGDEQSVLNYRYSKLAGDLILFGALFIIGAYHLCLFFYRRKDKSSLYFGMFCMIVGMRTLFVGERFFNFIFPGFNWEFAYKIQTLTFYLGVPIILMYFKTIFKKDIPLPYVRVVQAVSAAFSVIVLFTPVRTYSILHPIFHIFCAIAILILFFIFIKMIIKRRKNSIAIILGGMALILASLNDMIFLSVWFNDSQSVLLRKIISTGNLFAVGQLIFVFTNALVMAKRLSRAIDNEEVATAKLKYINMNLDKLVKERTKELENTKLKIEEQKEELQRTNLILQKLSLRDPLTNLWNRRYYDHILNIEWQKCMKESKPITLLLLDIDYFKEYNDCYGHIAGDECLGKVAQAIKHYFKNYPIVRYGGEEFVVILPGIGEEDAINAAEFLRRIIENLKIPHSCSAVSSYVTISIGYATLIPIDGMSHETLFRKADKSLYEAKTAGRNRVGAVN